MSTPWGIFFLHNSRESCLCVLDPYESPTMILYFIGDLVDDLNSRGSFLSDLRSTKGCFNAFNPLALRVFVSFSQLRVFLSFLMHS